MSIWASSKCVFKADYSGQVVNWSGEWLPLDVGESCLLVNSTPHNVNGSFEWELQLTSKTNVENQRQLNKERNQANVEIDKWSQCWNLRLALNIGFFSLE